jgi:alkylhydroperoxidase/carboxymuconolactone decarboxylase family protein YurZ
MNVNFMKYFYNQESDIFIDLVKNEFDYRILPERLRLLTSMAACQGLGLNDKLKGFINWGIDYGIDIREIYEILLQGYLFCGYPRAIESFFCFAGIILDKYPDQRHLDLDSNLDIEHYSKRGYDLALRIYGKNLDLVLQNIRNLSPELAYGMINEGYGRIISREGLDIIARELAIVATLTVCDMPRQLYSHIRGAFNVGADKAQIEAVIKQGRLFASDEIIDRCLSIFEKSLGK